jgi:hypothetical protein
MRGNPGEFEKPNEGNDRGMRGNQMTVEWEGNEGKPNELGNDRGMRGEMRGNRMRGMRGMIVEWKGNEENLWETGMRGEWQRNERILHTKKNQIYNSYHKLIWLSSYEKKKLILSF